MVASSARGLRLSRAPYASAAAARRGALALVVAGGLVVSALFLATAVLGRRRRGWLAVGRRRHRVAAATAARAALVVRVLRQHLAHRVGDVGHLRRRRYLDRGTSRAPGIVALPRLVAAGADAGAVRGDLVANLGIRDLGGRVVGAGALRVDERGARRGGAALAPEGLLQGRRPVLRAGGARRLLVVLGDHQDPSAAEHLLGDRVDDPLGQGVPVVERRELDVRNAESLLVRPLHHLVAAEGAEAGDRVAPAAATRAAVTSAHQAVETVVLADAVEVVLRGEEFGAGGTGRMRLAFGGFLRCDLRAMYRILGLRAT